jgi:hypothetical protein
VASRSKNDVNCWLPVTVDPSHKLGRIVVTSSRSSGALAEDTSPMKDVITSTSKYVNAS